MPLRSILAALRSIPPLPRPRAAGRRAGFRPRLEPLDDRRLPSFSPAVTHAVGDNPLAVATGDFNGDGKLDLVTAEPGGTVSVLLGDGLGGFGTRIQSPAGLYPVSVAVGDFDADGNLDVAAADPGGGGVTVLLGNGTGGFAAPVSIPLTDGSVPQSIAVGDFNADGKLDLGVASNLYNPGFYYTGYYGGTYWYPGYNTGSAHVLVGDGQGGFADAGGAGLGRGSVGSAAVADFNGDGNRDFVTVNTDYNSVDVLTGDGLGNLVLQASLYPGGGTAGDVAAGDVNGDGKTDLVTANRYSDTVGVLPGNGLGGFGPAQAYDTGGYAASVALADFNHDGAPDVLTADTFADGVSVLLGRGNGTFSRPVVSATGAYAWGAAAGDFNGDGWADAAAPDYYGADVAVLVNDHAWPAANAPSVSINDVTVTEGNTGSVTATFTLTLTAASAQPVTVHYALADGSAAAGSDYAAASGDVTIPAGQTSQTFTVAVLGDRVPEPTENFLVNLSGATNAFVGDGQGVGTILDNEPRVSVGDVTVTEGNTGTVTATLTVRLSVAYDQAVTVHFATADGSAIAGSDYAAASGDVTIPAGQTTQSITVAVLGDRVPESTENFLVNLSSPSGNAAIADGLGVVTILDNEPKFSITDVSKAEGNGNGKNSTTAFNFTVSLSAAYDQAVTVHFATADGTAKVSDNDYAAASGTLTFAPGETTKTVTVSVKCDKTREPDEWFAVNLSGASSNALIADSQGIGRILNDDNH
jgi:hypothetical protein